MRPGRLSRGPSKATVRAMPIAIGQKIPSVKFKRVLADGSVADLDSAAVFAGKKAVLFGVPGPFTPTCHKHHLPSYVARARELAAKGIDTVVCMSVADHWVMRAWADDQDAEGKVDMLADGNAELTRQLGLEVDLAVANMGTRCKRFVATLEDGKITSLEVETSKGIEVTGADACLLRLK